MAQPTKEERIAEFLRRLEAQPSASSAEEALELISETLNEVEDELTDIPFDPEKWQTDGRLYPPQEDNARDVPGRDDLVCYRNRGHKTYIRSNGAIEIRDLRDQVIVSKQGSDGRGVELED